MADEVNENGTANGDVPEIELIIKVSLLPVNSNALVWACHDGYM